MYKELNYCWASAEGGLPQRLNTLQRSGQLQIKSKERGADREQWFLTASDCDYLVFIEHISESAWIESLAAKDMEKLQFFYNLLFCDGSE